MEALVQGIAKENVIKRPLTNTEIREIIKSVRQQHPLDRHEFPGGPSSRDDGSLILSDEGLFWTGRVIAEAGDTQINSACNG
jgi:hypothetical protein